MFRGYIKLWRKIEDNPLSHDPDFMAIWVWILLLANHKFKEWKIGYQKIPIKRGQFITSRNKLSIITGVNESKLERTMTYLQSEQQIEQQKYNNYRLITVINYNIYQPSEQPNEQQVNSKRTASEQQVNTTKECKNEKNEKNEKNGLVKNQPLRNNLKFPKDDYSEIIKLYEQLTGIKHQNNEYLPIQQTIKTMFLNGRTKQEIMDCMCFINNREEECWSQWNLQTINKQLPRFLSGKF